MQQRESAVQFHPISQSINAKVSERIFQMIFTDSCQFFGVPKSAKPKYEAHWDVGFFSTLDCNLLTVNRISCNGTHI